MTPATEIKLTQPGGEPFDTDAMARFGAHVLSLIGTSVLLGHESPALSLVYAEADPDDPLSQLCLDAFGACLAGEHVAGEHRERLRSWAQESGLTRIIAERTGQGL